MSGAPAEIDIIATDVHLLIVRRVQVVRWVQVLLQRCSLAGLLSHLARLIMSHLGLICVRLFPFLRRRTASL